MADAPIRNTLARQIASGGVADNDSRAWMVARERHVQLSENIRHCLSTLCNGKTTSSVIRRESEYNSSYNEARVGVPVSISIASLRPVLRYRRPTSPTALGDFRKLLANLASLLILRSDEYHLGERR